MMIINEWLSNNRLILNLSKTHGMHLSNKYNDSDISNLYIKINNDKIGFVTHTKILGVTIDSKLKFNTHIELLCKKVNAKSFLISRSRHLFSQKFCQILFKLFIQSHFDYCATLFIHPLKADKNRLEKCFAKSIHRILNINISKLSINEQLDALKEISNKKMKSILPLSYRQMYHYIFFLYRIVIFQNTKLYKKLNKFVKIYDKSKYNTRNVYVLPMFRRNIYKYSFTRLSIQFLNCFLNKFISDQELNKQNKKPVTSLKEFLLSDINQIYDKLSKFLT